MSDAKADLAKAAEAVRDSVTLLSRTRPTMEQFMKECQDMESFGSVLAPALFLDPRREKVAKAIEPPKAEV